MLAETRFTLKKGAPGEQVWDLLCVQLARYLERGPLMWMMPLHLHVNQKSDYDMMIMFATFCIYAMCFKDATERGRWRPCIK